MIRSFAAVYYGVTVGLTRAVIVIFEDAVSFAVEVIKLFAFNGPNEQADGRQNENNSDWNQDIQAFHQESSFNDKDTGDGLPVTCGVRRARRPLIKRCEFNTTRIELNDMPTAAHSGVMNPLIATGIATML